MTEYKGYAIESAARLMPDGRWEVAARITRTVDGRTASRRFAEPASQRCLLEVEADKAALHLAKRLIDLGLAGL
ncbi:MAG: hypothetical protein JNG85_03405 [Spirochaetaceae bacterium]|nr:hypothetical protein [Spirochaetaceae bacterium]